MNSSERPPRGNNSESSQEIEPNSVLKAMEEFTDHYEGSDVALKFSEEFQRYKWNRNFIRASIDEIARLKEIKDFKSDRLLLFEKEKFFRLWAQQNEISSLFQK